MAADHRTGCAKGEAGPCNRDDTLSGHVRKVQKGARSERRGPRVRCHVGAPLRGQPLPAESAQQEQRRALTSVNVVLCCLVHSFIPLLENVLSIGPEPIAQLDKKRLRLYPVLQAESKKV